VIESAVMTQDVIETALRGNPTWPPIPPFSAATTVDRRNRPPAGRDPRLAGRRRPLSSPAVLAQAVARGLMDAPQLVNNRYAPGQVRTRSIGGAVWPVGHNGQPSTNRRVFPCSRR